MKYVSIVRALMLALVMMVTSIVANGQSMNNFMGQKWYPHDARIARNHNVCKKLNGDVLIFAIFVDTKQASPWTTYDKETTIDSLELMKKWLEDQANDNDIELNIKIDHAHLQMQTQQGSRARTSRSRNRNRSSRGPRGGRLNYDLEKPLHEILRQKKGVEEVNQWGDRVVTALTQLDNKERFIAKLRNDHYVESVVLMFMMNNYYKSDLLMDFNTMSNEEIEFVVTSFKYPNLMAYEVLKIFGATALYWHQYGSTKKAKAELSETYKKNIMAWPERSLGQQKISKVTKYLIGWENKRFDPERNKNEINEGPIHVKNRGDFLRRQIQ